MRKRVRRFVAGGLVGLLSFFAIIIGVFVFQHDQGVKMEVAIQRLIDEVNIGLGVDYVKVPDLREQCNTIIKEGFESGGRYDISVAYADIAGIEVFEVNLPEHDVNAIPEDEFKEMFKEAASPELMQRIDTWRESKEHPAWELTLVAHERGQYIAELDDGLLFYIQDQFDSAIEEKHEELLEHAESYKMLGIARDMKASMQRGLPSKDFLQHLSVDNIEKKSNGSYKVAVAYLDPNLFEGTGEVIVSEQGDLGEGFDAFLVEILGAYGEELPATSVLSGEESGQAVTIVSNSCDIWMRFYQISSDDVEEEGVQVLSCLIRGGESLKVQLPSGYYKMIHGIAGTDSQWFGNEYGFASTAVAYERWDRALHSQSGRYYTLTIDASEGNTGATKVPWDDL